MSDALPIRGTETQARVAEREMLRADVFACTYHHSEPQVYGTLGKAQALIRLLERELAAAREDTERIDWLQTRGPFFDVNGLDFGAASWDDIDLRAAIDERRTKEAARREEEDDEHRGLIRVRWPTLEQLIDRDAAVGRPWWERMKREAREADQHPVLYAWERRNELAQARAAAG